MKTKILSILALLLMTVTQGAWAQETLTVFDGTAVNRYIPMNSYIFDNYTKCECIIPASELTAMEGGRITAITFYAYNVGQTNTTFGSANQKVFLKEVSETTLGSSFSGMEGATVVFDDLLPMPTTGGYTITISPGYTYNGGNLLIGVYNDAIGEWNQVTWYGNNNQSSGVSAYGYSTLSPAEVFFSPQTFLPKTTFTYETPDPNAGLLTGRFSVSSTKQVQFSKGNLQYVGTWQFAANQYDIFGASQSDDHRDLFGWGTKTNPNNTSTTNGDYSWAEWGENTITNGCTGWRTLTKDEWGYLFTDRTNASTLRTFATVNSVTGLIVMPDGWTASGVSLTITTANYTTNVLSTSQWATLEKQGCVFLPAAGGRDGTNVMNVGSIGDYWSSDASGETNAYDLNFSNNHLLPQNTAGQRHYGWSVRLVKDYIFTGLGTEASPYLIASTTDWNNISAAVNGGETYSGKYFKMTANVGTVSTWMTGTFSGTFDGDGNTLTVGYSSSASGCAPFGNLRAATIKNLIVDGTISTSGDRAGGIAYWVLEGNMTYITNCRVSATINSTFSGGASTGGIVGSVQDYGTDGKLTITGCAFTGSLLGSSTHTCGGFVGWNGGTLTIENSLFAPASVTMGTTYSATFTRGGTVTNSYYTQKFNEAQGMQARTIVKGDGVSTLSVTKGSGTTYNVAGITVYSNGVDYNSTFYGGSGQSVSLALTHETRTGYQFTQYAASQGTLSAQTATSATLTMPAANSTANDAVTVTAQYFSGEGTQASPYLIASTTDWNNISAAVNGGETYSGKYFKMTANVGTVSTTVGTSANPFNGTFDGNGHTLDVNISNSNPDTRTAPFAWAGGSAVIKNLHVTGSLTNTARTSGIVGSCYATTQISSCRVSATISGGNHTSGISISGGQITNCLFDGKINGTDSTAGFATYVAEGTKITNCLFKPQSGSSIPSNQGCFYTSESGKTPTFDNCYYTSTAGGTAQGTNGSGMTAAQLVENLGPSNWKVVDGNAIPKVHPNLAGEGTEASPYLIASTTDWNNLVSAVNAGETYSGNYFKMTANVGTVSTWMTGTFSGTFDGDGKTLTVDYSATTENCAPFGTLSGATVKKLKVAGSISSNQKLVAGIAALCSSTGNNVTNCLVSATINSSYSGNAADGGLVAVVDNGASLNVTGCAFAGKLLTTNGTTSCGGIVGWRRPSGTATITNCLYAPTPATGSETWIASAEGENGNANFCRWNSSEPTITNCYYTTDFGSGNFTAQGLQARSISAGDYVTVANAGAATVYNVSGITSYGTGIKYNNVLYAGSGDNVSLNITAPAGHVINTVSYTYEGGSETTMNPVNGVYSITMPDANVTINVTFVGVSRVIAGYGNDDQDFTKWVFIASPVSGSVAVGNVGNLTDATEEYNLYRFNQAADLEWENIKAVDNQGDSLHPDFKTLVNGHGYLYASKNDVTLMFMGPFNMKNDTTIALDYTTDNTDAGMRGWNLVGNPFPVRAYITDRSYYKISTDGTRVEPTEVSGACAIDSCSGVMVKANATGEKVTFSKTPAEQSTNNGNLHIALGQTVFDRAGVSTGSTTLDKAIVSFNEGSALGKFYFGNQNANIYIPQNGKDYAIASVSAGTDVARYVSTEVPVNFKANENGTYTISVNPEGVEMAYLHLIDNMTGSDVDLLALRQAQGPATYTFTAKTTDYESRFKLVFVANNDEDGSSTGSETFAFYSNGNWIIANDGDATLQVIDLNGRILSSETVNGSVSKSIHAAPGVYMIRLINGENVKVQKVVIE